MGMGMKSLKWEGIVTKNLFPHISIPHPRTGSNKFTKAVVAEHVTISAQNQRTIVILSLMRHTQLEK